LSRIIKGGKVKFFALDFSRAVISEEEEEEYFSPVQELLPEELFQNPEGEEVPSEVQESSPSEPPIDTEPAPTALETPQEEQETNGENGSPESISPEDSAEETTEPEKEIDLLSLPEVAERLAQLEQEAYEKGFAQGQKDGMERGRQQYESMASRLKELIKSLEGQIEHHVLALEGPIFSLVKVMAEKVIQKEIGLGPEVLKNCIREALKYVVEQSRVRLRVNPEDVNYMEEILQELSAEFSRFKDFELIPDANISRGGCLLETDFGLVDATYERKWREIVKKLDDPEE
jgi:flagellar assembly protein FliH